VSSWPRRRVVGFTVAFAVCPVWAVLVLTDGLAPAGRALFPLNATTLALSLAWHLIYGAILGHGLCGSQNRPGKTRQARPYRLERPRSPRHPLARLIRFRGAKRGANIARRRETQGHAQRRSMPLAGTSRYFRRRLDRYRLRLASEGFVGTKPTAPTRQNIPVGQAENGG
jgi:hypothetical protein